MARRFFALIAVDLDAKELERVTVDEIRSDDFSSLRRARVAAALQRLLHNTDVDLDECSCGPGDPCCACALRSAVTGRHRKKRRRDG